MGKRRDREAIVSAFNARSLHDDIVNAVRVFPSTTRRRQSRVEVDLTDYFTGRPRKLALSGCVNLSFIADFDVLTDNAFASTEGVRAFADDDRIRAIMREQMAHLNVDYTDLEGNPSASHPTVRKLADLSDLILFRVLFFGGTLEVIARGFTLTHPRALKAASTAEAARCNNEA